MAKPPTPVESSNTGIYHRETKKLYSAQIEELNKDYDLDNILTKVKQFAQSVLDAYEDRPPDYEEWERYFEVRKKDKEAAKQLRPKTPLRMGIARTPSKAERVPQNVEEQLHDAQWLRAYGNLASQALEKGDTHKAALYGYFVGRYCEKLQVRQVEHVAMRGIKVGEGAQAGGKEKAIKPEIIKVWKDSAADLWSDDPRRSKLKVAEIIESEFRSTKFAGNVETIRKKI